MRAPNLHVLFNVRENLEDWLAAYLKTHGITCYTARSQVDQYSDLFVWCEWAGEAWADHKAPHDITGTGVHEQDRFTAAVQIAVQTERADEQKSSIKRITGKHAETVARIRVAMLNGNLAISTPNLKYYTLAEVIYQGSNHDTIDDRNTDVTVLNYEITYAINTEAWPV